MERKQFFKDGGIFINFDFSLEENHRESSRRKTCDE
jgi:hypothetical protein